MSETHSLPVCLVFLLMLIGCTRPKPSKHEQLTQCGELLNQTKGIIQTPGFPKRFPVPIRCRWVIDASAHPDKSIVVYLTQLYVTTGIKFTDYVYYDSDSGLKYSENVGHIVTPENVTSSPWIRSFAPYLMIEFELSRLEGNHLRFLDDKHNVFFMYGFNVTFELTDRETVVRNSCNARLCSLLGECYASSDFTVYECSCFQGFSGPNCAQGPLCEGHTCKNGGTCVHSSAVSFGCKCAKGFAGSKCEFPLKLACDGKDCNRTQCFYDGVSQPSCDCDDPQNVPEDRARYEGTLHLLNATQLKHGSNGPESKNRSLDSYLGKAIFKYLRMFNVSKVERLKILNYTVGSDVVFHFFGSKKDEESIRSAFRRFSEKEAPALGASNLTLRQDATLLIEEFSISCIAQGSIYMTFTWLKDGASINESVITRSVSMHLIYLSRGRYQYTLMIDKASPLDEGIYTCHVSDWHVQECKGTHVKIAGSPEIRLTPMSATVEKGANLDIICIPLNNRPKQEKFGYSWVKNKQLLKMTPGREVWEDLYLSHYNGGINTGSVLEITNIQKSATYTCQAQGIGASSELSVQVEVVNKSVVPLCSAEGKYGVAWQATAPGMETIAECPFHSGGHARRGCRLTDYNTTQWDIPNFTGCVTSEIELIYVNFTRLTIGYEVTNGSVTLRNLLDQVSKRPTYLPGECERILDILSLVLRYLNSSSLFADFQNSTEPFYSIVNLLLSHEHCFITEKKVVQLQTLVKSKGIVWGSLLKDSSSVFRPMSSLAVQITKVAPGASKAHLFFPPKTEPRPSWLTDGLGVRVDSSKVPGESLTVVVIAYRNLTQFLKARYLARFEDGTDEEFEINSRLLTVELGQRRYRIDPAEDSFQVEVTFDHFVKEYDPDVWKWSCGVTDFASFRNTWDLISCTGQLVYPNATRCRCRKPGTYAVLLVSKSYMVPSKSNESEHFVVIVGCGCCLIQSLLTLCLLLPYWIRRKTCLVFLKMQCCLATACAMSVFIYSIQRSVSKAVFPLVTTFLEIFLLVGLSSHLSKLLVVYTEIIQLPSNRHMKETVICIITGVPILAVLCNFLGYHTTGWNLHSWWIIKGSMIFNVFITSAALLVILFVFLYVSVLRKLYVLSERCADKNKAVFRRIGLLKRGGVIFVTMILMESASIFYINVLDVSSQYFFSSSSALLGFVIMFCYILRSECSFHDKLVKSLKSNSVTQEDDFSSDSIINPLRFFTKQDGDAESESAPPLPTPISPKAFDMRNKNKNSINYSEQIVMSETKSIISDKGNTGTLETFVSTLNGSIDEKLTLDSYKPRSFAAKAGDDFGEYVEQDTPREDEAWNYANHRLPVPKPEVGQCYLGRDAAAPVASQEIITTRVCVELGVITTHQKNEATGQEVATPAIVLCSVDVEPCQSRLVEMTEVVNECCGNAGGFVLGVTGQDANNPVYANTGSGPAPQQTTKTPEDTEAQPEDGGKDKQENAEKAAVPAAEGDRLEGMLDRISHDLDYLLNRKPETIASRKASKPPSSFIGKRIPEEDEENASAGEEAGSTEF